jgi:arginase family enzyme
VAKRRRVPAGTGRTVVRVFPFDLFGGGGTTAGAELLADLVREILDDAALETRPTRQHALLGRVDVAEELFDTVEAVVGWRELGRELAAESLEAGDFQLWLGGNHLSVLPVYESLGPKDLVIQFDAHLDCYDLYDTTVELSHGNFLRHATSLPTIANVGHRDLFLLPAEVQKTFRAAVPAPDIDRAMDTLTPLVAAANRVWIDVDVDVFDPAFCPAVFLPTPFGPSPMQVLRLIDAVWSPKVVGFSVSEFTPGRDVRDTGLQLLAWLVEWVLLRRSS